MISYKNGFIRGFIKVQKDQFPIRLSAAAVEAYLPKDSGVAFYLSGEIDPYVLEGTMIGADLALDRFWVEGETGLQPAAGVE